MFVLQAILSSVEEVQHAAAAVEDVGVLPPGAYHDLHDAEEDTEPPSYRGHPHAVLELVKLGYHVRSPHCASLNQCVDFFLEQKSRETPYECVALP